MEGGCSVICVDNDLRSLEEITTKLRSRYRRVKEIEPEHNSRERESRDVGPTIAAYECDLLNCNAVRKIAKKVEDEVGGIDVLVTCAGQPNQDIFDTASTTLMSHHWVSISQRTDLRIVVLLYIKSRPAVNVFFMIFEEKINLKKLFT